MFPSIIWLSGKRPGFTPHQSFNFEIRVKIETIMSIWVDIRQGENVTVRICFRDECMHIHFFCTDLKMYGTCSMFELVGTYEYIIRN